MQILFHSLHSHPRPVSNFIDLSGIARSEGTLFYKLMQRLAEKRDVTTYIPIKFLSLARNNLARAPYSSLNLIGTSLEYLSLAGNNFGLLNASSIKRTYILYILGSGRQECCGNRMVVQCVWSN